MKLKRLTATQEGLTKIEETDQEGGVAPLLTLLAAADKAPSPGAAILDLGCGVGNGVASLLARGFDAYGVDIFEFWGEHADYYWSTQPLNPPPPERLSVGGTDPYRLPYADATFDHVISAEVLEHCDDRPAVFAELHRVLKPGGTSVHIFPARWSPLIEGHTGIPLSPLCKSDAYLRLTALAGFRHPRRKHMGWWEAYKSNEAQMDTTHYPSQRQLLREARAQGLDARFAHRDYIQSAGTGWTRLHRRLDAVGLGWVVLAAGPMALTHMLYLRRPH